MNQCEKYIYEHPDYSDQDLWDAATELAARTAETVNVAVGPENVDKDTAVGLMKFTAKTIAGEIRRLNSAPVLP
jgi:hypothetical protein